MMKYYIIMLSDRQEKMDEYRPTNTGTHIENNIKYVRKIIPENDYIFLRKT